MNPSSFEELSVHVSPIADDVVAVSVNDDGADGVLAEVVDAVAEVVVPYPLPASTRKKYVVLGRVGVYVVFVVFGANVPIVVKTEKDDEVLTSALKLSSLLELSVQFMSIFKAVVDEVRMMFEAEVGMVLVVDDAVFDTEEYPAELNART